MMLVIWRVIAGIWVAFFQDCQQSSCGQAPLKQMKIYKDGSPRAMFWSGNEKLKGDAITLPPVPPIKPPAPPPPPIEVVDLATCGGAEATWKVPAAGAAAGPIALNASACLGVTAQGAAEAVVLSVCGAAAPLFAVLRNGSITHGGKCMDALPTLRMAACAADSHSQQWSTAGGAIKLVISTAESDVLSPTNLWQFDDALVGANTGSIGNPPLTCVGSSCELAAAGAGHSGHGLTLDGKSYLGNGDKAVPAGVPIGNEAYTVCAWIKPKQPVGMMGVVGWGDWGTANGSTAFSSASPGRMWNCECPGKALWWSLWLLMLRFCGDQTGITQGTALRST